jgi:hypothetical protein
MLASVRIVGYKKGVSFYLAVKRDNYGNLMLYCAGGLRMPVGGHAILDERK